MSSTPPLRIHGEVARGFESVVGECLYPTAKTVVVSTL